MKLIDNVQQPYDHIASSLYVACHWFGLNEKNTNKEQQKTKNSNFLGVKILNIQKDKNYYQFRKESSYQTIRA